MDPLEPSRLQNARSDGVLDDSSLPFRAGAILDSFEVKLYSLLEMPRRKAISPYTPADSQMEATPG